MYSAAYSLKRFKRLSATISLCQGLGKNKDKEFNCVYGGCNLTK